MTFVFLSVSDTLTGAENELAFEDFSHRSTKASRYQKQYVLQTDIKDLGEARIFNFFCTKSWAGPFVKRQSICNSALKPKKDKNNNCQMQKMHLPRKNYTYEVRNNISRR